jgi:hypothetical protein
MSVAAERYIHFNAPDPAQLRQLAAVGIASAVSRQGLKSPSRFPGSHYFVDSIDAVDAVAEASMVNGGPAEVYHRVAGRAGRVMQGERDVKIRRWSLKFYDVFAMRTTRPNKLTEAGWLNAQTLYSFEWNECKTLLAKRRLRLVDGSGSGDRELGDIIDGFSIPDDIAALWHAGDEMSRVTAPECDALIHDMRNYFALVEAQTTRQ